jgi:hypothetical protein
VPAAFARGSSETVGAVDGERAAYVAGRRWAVALGLGGCQAHLGIRIVLQRCHHVRLEDTKQKVVQVDALVIGACALAHRQREPLECASKRRRAHGHVARWSIGTPRPASRLQRHVARACWASPSRKSFLRKACARPFAARCAHLERHLCA